MGKKSTPKAPKAPDPNELIDAQANANRVDSYSPYGSTVYKKVGEDEWRSDTEFTPELQGLFTKYLGSAGSDPISYHDYAVQPNLTNFNSDAYKWEDKSYDQYAGKMFDRAKGLLDPVYQRQNKDFEQSMANKGLPLGGEAYDDAFYCKELLRFISS